MSNEDMTGKNQRKDLQILKYPSIYRSMSSFISSQPLVYQSRMHIPAHWLWHLHSTKLLHSVAFLIFMRIILHYFWDGFIPLVRSFTRNFQASVDSYVADALECKQKGMFIAQSESSTSNSSSGLYNSNEKIKFLLKDMLGLEAFQTFLEMKSIGLGGMYLAHNQKI